MTAVARQMSNLPVGTQKHRKHQPTTRTLRTMLLRPVRESFQRSLSATPHSHRSAMHVYTWYDCRQAESQLLLSAQLCQHILVAGLLLLVEVEQTHAQT